MLTVLWVQRRDTLPAKATCVHLLSSPVLPLALIYQKRSFLAPALCVSLRSLAWNIDSWNGFACNPRHQIFLTMKKDQGFVLPAGYKPTLGQNKASRWNEIQSSCFFKSENCTLTLRKSIECIIKSYLHTDISHRIWFNWIHMILIN